MSVIVFLSLAKTMAKNGGTANSKRMEEGTTSVSDLVAKQHLEIAKEFA